MRVALCNTVGGQDELVFDGHSLFIESDGAVLARAPGFEEALLVVDLDDPAAAGLAPLADDLEQMRRALVLGLRDYVAKNGFGDVVVCVSGGIDSALSPPRSRSRRSARSASTASRCRPATPPRRRGTTRAGSPRTSAATSASSPIEPVVEAVHRRPRRVVRRPRAGSRGGEPPGADPRDARHGAVEQVRLAASSRAGNKSELSVGYATLYGDMAGGFALLKDVFKTDVFRLSRHLNEQAGASSSRVDDRAAPSAELREGQLDEDSLPPYSELDRVLEAYVEDDRTLEELSATASTRTSWRAVALIDRAEYKRRQAPPGCGSAEGVRPRPADADHEPLAELSRSARSAGASRSPRAPPGEPASSASVQVARLEAAHSTR